MTLAKEMHTEKTVAVKKNFGNNARRSFLALNHDVSMSEIAGKVTACQEIYNRARDGPEEPPTPHQLKKIKRKRLRYFNVRVDMRMSV